MMPNPILLAIYGIAPILLAAGAKEIKLQGTSSGTGQGRVIFEMLAAPTENFSGDT